MKLFIVLFAVFLLQGPAFAAAKPGLKEKEIKTMAKHLAELIKGCSQFENSVVFSAKNVSATGGRVDKALVATVVKEVLELREGVLDGAPVLSINIKSEHKKTGRKLNSHYTMAGELRAAPAEGKRGKVLCDGSAELMTVQ